MEAGSLDSADILAFAAIDEIGFEYRSERFDSAVKVAMHNKNEERERRTQDDINLNWEQLLKSQRADLFV